MPENEQPEMKALDWARCSAEAAPRPEGWLGKCRKLVRYLALSGLSLLSEDGESNWLRCLHCHYVFDDQKPRFYDLMSVLQSIGTFVDTETCIEMAQGKREIDGRYFHLSMDDGLRNHFENAAPVLDDLGIPAIFFVPTNYLQAGTKEIVHYSTEVTNYQKPVQTMSWAEARMLNAWGFEIGSHTATHAKLSELDISALEAEVVGSKRRIESELGVECRYFAWPYGTAEAVDDLAFQAIRDADYEGCFSGSRGTVDPYTTEVFQLPRHHFEVDWPTSHVKFFASGHMEAGGG